LPVLTSTENESPLFWRAMLMSPWGATEATRYKIVMLKNKIRGGEYAAAFEVQAEIWDARLEVFRDRGCKFERPPASKGDGSKAPKEADAWPASLESFETSSLI